ncbi:MAG: Hsp70 family protein, partial [Planctomycetota bacterium]
EKPIRGEELPSEVILALILAKLTSDAELNLGTIEQAVVTVPAFFNEPCRKATMDAGRIAGMEVLDIINEPTAAAITYGVEKGFLSKSGESQEKEVILVFDLGGGTFDVTVMEIEGKQYTAIASAGDVYLGGIDWDNRIVDYVAEKFQTEYGRDPKEDPGAAEELLQKAIQAKHSLTAREEVTIHFQQGGDRLRCPLSRAEFEDITRDLLDRTHLTLNVVLSEANMQWSDLTRVLLVGGSTRMPAVATMLEELSGLEVDRSLSPDEAVANGAAIYAGLVLNTGGQQEGMTVTNVASHILGVLGTENTTGRKRRGIMIPRNARLPAKATRKFSTAKDGQARVFVEVVEGGDDSGNNATLIGTCIVEGLPPDLPKLTPVEVTFQYESNGRLNILAQLPTVQMQAALSLNRAAGLSEEEIASWKKRIEDGFGDDSVQIPTIEPEAAKSEAQDAASESKPAAPSAPPAEDDDDDIPMLEAPDDSSAQNAAAPGKESAAENQAAQEEAVEEVLLVQCPGCSKELQIPTSYMDKEFECSCGQLLLITT